MFVPMLYSAGMDQIVRNIQSESSGLPPLCVDLDGSLCRVDTFHYTLFSLLRRNFLYALLIPFWLLRGKAFVKQAVAQRVIDAELTYPLHPEVLRYLQVAHSEGRELYLTTGADRTIAERIAAEVGLFTAVVASDGLKNCTGSTKAEVLSTMFGAGQFDYLANDYIDLTVWKNARAAVLVSDDPSLHEQVASLLPIEATFSAGTEKARIADYVNIARPDHWFKNIFVLPGTLLALYFFPTPLSAAFAFNLFLAIAACCLVASSNYVINELLDADRDRHHPVKKERPLAAGRVSELWAGIEWILLGVVGVALGYVVNFHVGGACLFLWIMGTIYNIPPIRTKELPFLDVLSESINNPIRMAIGWYAVGVSVMPPISALFAYWMFGAFLMATKRLAEYRRIANPALAAQYRKSFSYYDEERLIVGTTFYVSLFITGSVVFMMLYRLELVLAIPFVAYLLSYYLYLGFKPDSPVQYPERLYRDKNLSLAVLICASLCIALFFIDIPQFRELFVLLEPR